MGEVHKLELVSIGENIRIDPDQVLEEAKGHSFDRLVIIGELPDGEIYTAGSANAGESLILLEMAKRQIVFGE